MPKLGHKFNKSNRTLGNKIEKGSYRLGHKLNMALSKADNTMKKIDNTIKDANQNGAGSLPVIGNGVKVAGFVSHLSRKATKSAHKNELEKHNRRKATEEALSSHAGSAFV